MASTLNRRQAVLLAGSAGLAAAQARPGRRRLHPAADPLPTTIPLPDDGWRLWIDEKADWQNDAIHLPGEFDFGALPVNAPSGGWDVLGNTTGEAVTLPATVEQFHWGAFGSRPYTIHEYAWAASDPVPQNGAWRGVSWWWRTIELPEHWRGRRILLNVRGARLRAEVFLNRRLVGYSILEELPFVCDLTAAARPGAANQLAIRITNPGGRYDWIDGDTIEWGGVRIPTSHGFGGLDRALSLEAHPMDGRIADLWVLNTPATDTVHAFVRLDPVPPDAHALALRIVDVSGNPLAAAIRPLGRSADGVFRYAITAKRAKRWTLSEPHLYRLAASWKTPEGRSARDVEFGFRSFGVEGVGRDAGFRFNGKAIRLYSAISWGYWGLNGLWPSPSLAEREVTQAKALGLNCLSFHRNVGKEDVFRAQDRRGLLRVMEPGGGKFALGRLPEGTKIDAHSVVMEKPQTEDDRFAQRYMIAKCVAMVRAFRSHPSLIQYTLQNENNADLDNPDTVAVLDAMRAEDESRIILLNDGMVAPPISAAQAWYAPYDPKLHRSDREPFGGWWDDHQGAGDQWHDRFYADPGHFNYDQGTKGAIVAFGEMEGCAVPDNHVLAIAETLRRGGDAYDLEDRRAVLAGYRGFLDRWGFRRAFPTAESLFRAVGRKSYESWQQYLENARINAWTDVAVISGWESTAIENHSGIVDNLRNFKSDPALIRDSLLPVRPVAKQRRMVHAVGERAVFDLFLLNDSGAPLRGALEFAMTGPNGRRMLLGRFPAPRHKRFSALVTEGFASPPLAMGGRYRFSLALPGHPAYERDLWVVDTGIAPARRVLRVGYAGIRPEVLVQLASIPGVVCEAAQPGSHYDVVVAGGLSDASTLAQRTGDDFGLTLQKSLGTAPVPGTVPDWIVAAVRNGAPLLVIAQEDGLADGIASQLAVAGAFRYDGQVGKFRAPWMGNWYFVREHAVYAGLPVDQAMDFFYQSPGREANGLIVDGPDVDVFVGYGRDHDRRVGAGTFTARLGAGRILFQRAPDFVAPAQLRFLRNALAWLCA